MDKELHILILEDVPADAELEEHELRKAGLVFTSKVVDTREAFLKELDEFFPDLILSDYDLPSFDGLTALRIAKEKCPDVPFILVTGKLGEEFAIEKLKEGATDYVLKGNLKRLVPSVNRALEEAKMITERKQAEKKINEQLEFLQTLLDTIPTPVFYKNIEGKYLGCNEAFELFTGMKKEELVGKTVYDMGPKEIADKYFEKDNELFQNPGLQTYEWKVRDKDGILRDVIFSKTIFNDGKGRVAGLIGVISDITGRKQTEELVKRLSHQYELVLNAAGEGIFGLDVHGNHTFVNPAAAQMLGYTVDELIGRHSHTT
jgi:PAS domain S-box-containing protein